MQISPCFVPYKDAEHEPGSLLLTEADAAMCYALAVVSESSGKGLVYLTGKHAGETDTVSESRTLKYAGGAHLRVSQNADAWTRQIQKAPLNLWTDGVEWRFVIYPSGIALSCGLQSGKIESFPSRGWYVTDWQIGEGGDTAPLVRPPKPQIYNNL